MDTKIAFPTGDGEKISQHFGRAKQYKIVTVTDGRVASSEMRAKPHHQEGKAAGHDPKIGQQMIAAVSDCQVLISGGIGAPMLARFQAAGLQVFLVKEQQIDAAVQAFIAGTLQNDPSLAHEPEPRG